MLMLIDSDSRACSTSDFGFSIEAERVGRLWFRSITLDILVLALGAFLFRDQALARLPGYFVNMFAIQRSYDVDSRTCGVILVPHPHPHPHPHPRARPRPHPHPHPHPILILILILILISLSIVILIIIIIIVMVMILVPVIVIVIVIISILTSSLSPSSSFRYTVIPTIIIISIITFAVVFCFLRSTIH